MVILKNIKKLKLNSYVNINSKTIRLLDEFGKMLGIFTFEEGIKIAKERNLDLVEISSNTNPIVCKIINFGKYQYFIKKKKVFKKNKNKLFNIKEIRLRPNIALLDFNVKINNAKKFILQGNKVKIILFFKGREIVHEEIGFSIIKKFKDSCIDFSILESDIKKEGKKLFIIIVPKKI